MRQKTFGPSIAASRLVSITSMTWIRLLALKASDGHAERAFQAKLMAFADSGHGGEIEVEWPEGPSFFIDLPSKRSLPGGTGV